MANYKSAISKVLLTEGGYVNDPDDNGGETYRGIARKFWANWSGWVIIDICKKDPKNFPKNLNTNPTLNELIIGFYKINFWDKVGGDAIKDQNIAYVLVDTAVLEGIKPAVKREQGICGMAQNGIIDQYLVGKLNSMA